MAYIGKSPALGNFVKLDAITVVNGQAAYTMQNGGVNFTDYSTVNQFLVSLNGIIQSPTSSFTVSGSTITFASNLVTNDVINFIIVFGNSLSAGTPTDGTVTSAKLASQDITFSEDIILGDSKKAIFGASSDLEVYHDGNHSHIRDNSTGDLRLRSTKIVLASDSMSYLEATNAGSVDIYHNSSKKLETTSSGINITGGVRLGGNNAANELNDYEEGTFTPGFNGSSSSHSGVSYNERYGRYIKIGSLVYVNVWISLSSISTPGSGYAVVNNLPFTVSSTDPYYASAMIGYATGFNSTNAPSGGYALKNSTNIWLRKRTSSDARDNIDGVVEASQMGDENLMISCVYEVN